MGDMKIAVVTALWYEDKFLPKLFSSLEKVNYPLDRWEIVMIDNRGSETAKRWIAENVTPKAGKALPHFELIPTDKNLGFAGGNNACIRRAIERGADAVYLLNEDAYVDPDSIMNAARRMQADERIGAVQSFISLDPPERGMNSIGNALHFLGFSYCEGYRMPKAEAAGLLRVRALAEKDLQVAAVSGAATLLRAEALGKTGLFDESYHMYHEDLDLSLRLREARWKLVIELSSVAYHRYDFSRIADKYFWMERNRYRLLLEHFRIPTLLVLLPGLLAAELGLLAMAIAKRSSKERFKIYRYFLDPRNWKLVIEKRLSVMERKDIDDRDLLDSAVASISYQEVSGPAMKFFNPLMAAYWAVARRIIYW
jgi:GT2 family glycosyltransferase